MVAALIISIFPYFNVNRGGYIITLKYMLICGVLILVIATM